MQTQDMFNATQATTFDASLFPTSHRPVLSRLRRADSVSLSGHDKSRGLRVTSSGRYFPIKRDAADIRGPEVNQITPDT